MKKAVGKKTLAVVEKHFEKVDPVLHKVFKKMGCEPLRVKSDPGSYFAHLCREIISQQLAGKAAEAILARFEKFFPKRRVTPEKLLTLSEEVLRGVGMSWAKARYVRDLAARTTRGGLDFRKFPSLEDAAVIAELVKTKGIGPWTAEMFLIFTLGREDVFSFGDLGLRRGFEKLYGKRLAKSRAGFLRQAERWRPYRSYAALALWHLHDNPFLKDGE